MDQSIRPLTEQEQQKLAQAAEARKQEKARMLAAGEEPKDRMPDWFRKNLKQIN